MGCLKLGLFRNECPIFNIWKQLQQMKVAAKSVECQQQKTGKSSCFRFCMQFYQATVSACCRSVYVSVAGAGSSSTHFHNSCYSLFVNALFTTFALFVPFLLYFFTLSFPSFFSCSRVNYFREDSCNGALLQFKLQGKL